MDKMDKFIIYPNDDGTVAIIMLALDCDLSIEETARKDVPAGKPYKIVDGSVFPKDPIFRDAWESDFSSPDGFGIGHDAWFAARRQS